MLTQLPWCSSSLLLLLLLQSTKLLPIFKSGDGASSLLMLLLQHKALPIQAHVVDSQMREHLVLQVQQQQQAGEVPGSSCQCLPHPYRSLHKLLQLSAAGAQLPSHQRACRQGQRAGVLCQAGSAGFKGAVLPRSPSVHSVSTLALLTTCRSQMSSSCLLAYTRDMRVLSDGSCSTSLATS